MNEWLKEVEERLRRDIGNGMFLKLICDSVNADDHVELHIAKSDIELIERGLTGKNPDAFTVSTFSDTRTANSLLGECVTTMLKEEPEFFLDLVESNPRKRFSLDIALDPDPRKWIDRQTGRLQFDPMQRSIMIDNRGQLKEMKTNAVRVVFRRNEQSRYRFSIVTAFPNPGKRLHLVGDIKPMVRQTGRDLTENLLKTPAYQIADPLCQAFLRIAADPAPFRQWLVEQGFANGNPGRSANLSVKFSALSARKCYEANIGYHAPRIRELNAYRKAEGGLGLKPATNGEEWTLSTKEDWDRLLLINRPAAALIGDIEKSIQEDRIEPHQAHLSQTRVYVPSRAIPEKADVSSKPRS